VLSWEEARRIIDSVREAAGDEPDAKRLLRSWHLAATAYAQARAEWLLATREERVEMDRHRTRLHDAFIGSCNALSRRFSGEGKDIGWRRALGDDRKRIGDLACYLHCTLGLEAR
jgi:hypothetical protein